MDDIYYINEKEKEMACSPEGFVKLAGDNPITIKKRPSDIFPYEASFPLSDYNVFVILRAGELEYIKGKLPQIEGEDISENNTRQNHIKQFQRN